jgi:hypothetical protein
LDGNLTTLTFALPIKKWAFSKEKEIKKIRKIWLIKQRLLPSPPQSKKG